MAQLKAGHVSDFANSLAQAMDNAMQEEWQRVKGEPLPSGFGTEDRQILFVAVARGLLQYLQEHEADLGTDTVQDTVSGHAHHLVIDYDQ